MSAELCDVPRAMRCDGMDVCSRGACARIVGRACLAEGTFVPVTALSPAESSHCAQSLFSSRTVPHCRESRRWKESAPAD